MVEGTSEIELLGVVTPLEIGVLLASSFVVSTGVTILCGGVTVVLKPR